MGISDARMFASVAVCGAIAAGFGACLSFGDLTGAVGDAGSTDGAFETNGEGAGPNASDSPNSCSPDLTADSKNCGVCRHDCLGGKCTSSRCQPVLVVDDPALGPFAMLEDDDTLYFTSARPLDGVANIAKVAKASINNSPSYTILGNFNAADGGNVRQVFPTELSLAAGNLYVALSSSDHVGGNYAGGILKCTTGACGDVTKIDVPNLTSAAVYSNGKFVTYDGQPYGLDEHLYLDDLALDNSTAPDIKGSHVTFAVIDASVVYYSASTGVFSIKAGDSAPTMLSNIEAKRLVVQGNTVYFTSNAVGAPSVQAVGLGVDSAAPSAIATGSSFWQTPMGIAVDTQSIYITDEGDVTLPTSGSVVRCPIAGCGDNNVDAVILSTGEAAGGNPSTVVDDTNAIYWGDLVGKIWKLAK